MSINNHIERIKELPVPNTIIKELPNIYIDKINSWRRTVVNIMNKSDPRIIIIVGPCSIHDIFAAKQYANQLAVLRQLHPNIFIILRAYFEKPRTTVGWKGLINDPDLDSTYNIAKGLRLAREFLLYCASIDLPTGCEFLDTISPQWLSDLVTWGAIGARTTESQIHRELASGLSMPIGFKNGTGGRLVMAINAIKAASLPHAFLGVNECGMAAIVHTTGNPDTSIILRGGKTPNYYEHDILSTETQFRKNNLETKIIVDCSHSNSQNIYDRQPEIALYVVNVITKYRQMRKNNIVVGLMIESNLYEGKQTFDDTVQKNDLEYGVSITDACISWQKTKKLLFDVNKLLNHYA